MTNSTSPSYTKIAADFALWQERVDTGGTMTRDEFSALTEEAKVGLMVEAFGPEEAATQARDITGWSVDDHRDDKAVAPESLLSDQV